MGVMYSRMKDLVGESLWFLEDFLVWFIMWNYFIVCVV